VTVVQVRVHQDQDEDPDADLILDIYGRRVREANVQWDSQDAHFLKDLVPSPPAADLLRLGMAAYCTDKLLARQDVADDDWTRDVELRLPVYHRDGFDSQRELLQRAMSFLSGDRWLLRFSDHPLDPPTVQENRAPRNVGAVALFSGGLDSLAGVIDQLAAGTRIVGVAHFDAGITPKRQRALWAELQGRFGGLAVSLRRLLLRPIPESSNPVVHHQLPPTKKRESTTRARSLMFLTAAVAVADAIDPRCPVVMPENGFIGINVPLIGARQGSLSTRTTHPHFIGLLREAVAGLGLDHEIRNPYRLMTKGEILAASGEPKLLERLAPDSLSCSHPEATRHRPPHREGNCGYCWPCLIRRASMHHVGWDRTDDYIFDALTDTDLLQPQSESGASLRAAVASLHDEPTAFSVLRNGPVPATDIEAFFGVHQRGRQELVNWLDGGAGDLLRSWLP
jgi:7-cyano-7-deazaguanine synthase in queuosine biosynthesis